mgnify:CR=1 FL=1
MSPFETFKNTCQAELQTILPERVSAIDWSTQRLNLTRADGLQKLLNHAASLSRWHRQRLESIDLNTLTPDDLTALPTMNKQDVQANFDAISTDPKVTKAWCDRHLAAGEFYTDGTYCILASGGSSGQPGIQVYNPNAAMQFAAASFRGGIRYAARQKLPPSDPSKQFWIVAAAGAAHPTRIIPPLLGISGENLRSITDPFEELVATLNQKQPKQLMIYSSFLGRLIEAQLAGKLNISPDVISMTSETPSQPDIARAKEIFNCRISSNWGSMEFGTMGLSSQFEDGHLLSDDMLIIEAVNENNEAVKPGENATKLLITNLYNTTLPLIRYELTDQLIIHNHPAACHSKLRAASWVEGRNEDHFIYGDVVTGKNIHVHAHLFRHVLEHTPDVIEYQVRQTFEGAEIFVTTNGKAHFDNCNLQSTLASDLENIGLTGASVAVHIVPSIERTSAQKLRRFIPLSQ